MNTCPECGARIEPGSSVCAACGAAVRGATASFEAVPGEVKTCDVTGIDVSDVPALVVRKGVEVGECFYLDRPRIVVGRDPSADIFLNDVTVSRAHAVIEVGGEKIRIVDDGSLNGTYVNDKLVTEAELKSGDTVQIGRFQMVVVSAGGAKDGS